MGKALADFGMQTAGNVINAGMGLILGDHYDRRQLRQQTDLQNLQIKGQKEMADYNYNKQLDMWNATNFEAQKEHLKKAGLNPGLLYGMSGGGGSTTGSGAGAGPSGASAPTGGGEVQSMIGMGIQSALLQAQKENIEANTEKTKAETANVPLTGEQTKAQTGLTNIQTELGKIEQQVKSQTIEAAIRTIDAAGEKMMNEAEMGRYGLNVKDATWETEIAQIKANLAGTLLKNALTKTQDTATKQQIQNAITQLDLMKDELYKTNPEKRKQISAQMQAIWNTISKSGDNNTENGQGVINELIKLIPVK